MKRTQAELEKEWEALSEQYRYSRWERDKDTVRRIRRRLRILFNLLYPELK